MGSRERFASSLLEWYSRQGRDLPWRRDPDPYRVWISEIMLQQTTVATTIPYYERFLRRFPNVSELARAGEEELLAAWSGLGYYHRARNLLESSRIICGKHGGRIPDTLEDLLALPGIGAYTAGAILSIGHHLPFPAIDGNIQRVMARVGALKGEATRAPVRREIEAMVTRLMPGKRASDFNQALMDLGAMVCTPRDPGCAQCPVEYACEARRRDLVASIPTRAKTARSLPVEMAAVAVLKKGECLLVMRQDSSINRGLWEFPLAGLSREEDAVELAQSVGANIKGKLGYVRHAITRHRIRITVYGAEPSPRGGRSRRKARSSAVSEPQRRLSTSEDATLRRWCTLEEITNDGGVPLSGTARKIAKLLLKDRSSKQSRLAFAGPS